MLRQVDSLPQADSDRFSLHTLAAALSAWGQPQLALRFVRTAYEAWLAVPDPAPSSSKVEGMLVAISDLSDMLCFFGNWRQAETLAKQLEAWMDRKARDQQSGLHAPQHADTLAR